MCVSVSEGSACRCSAKVLCDALVAKLSVRDKRAGWCVFKSCIKRVPKGGKEGGGGGGWEAMLCRRRASRALCRKGSRESSLIPSSSDSSSSCSCSCSCSLVVGKKDGEEEEEEEQEVGTTKGIVAIRWGGCVGSGMWVGRICMCVLVCG